MELKDAMAEVILRAVLAHPERCPKIVAERAIIVRNNLVEKWVSSGRAWPMTMDMWIETLTEHSHILPAILEGYDEK